MVNTCNDLETTRNGVRSERSRHDNPTDVNMVRFSRHALVLITLLAVIPATVSGQQEEIAQSPPLTLSQAVDLALEQSRDLRDARYGLEVAEEQVSEAWSEVFPQINASADYTRNLKPVVSFLPAVIFDPTAAPDEFIQVQFGADNSWQASLTLDQALFRPAVFLGLGAADRFRTLQRETVRGRTQNVVTRVRNTFYTLLLSQEQVRLLDNSVRRVTESLKDTRALNRAGLSSDYDVLRLEVELANLNPNLQRVRNQVRTDRRALALELDHSDGGDLEVAGSLAAINLSDLDENSPANREVLQFAGVSFDEGAPTAESLIAIAFENRSDLRQLELTERLRHTEMRVEQVAYLPTISLFGNYAVSAQQNGRADFFGTGVNDRATSSLAGVRVSIPIFQGLRRDARIDQKRAALRQAETQSELQIDLARTQIQTLADGVSESKLRAEAQAFAVQQARRGFAIAGAQYREGLGSQLELTDSEVALRQSEFNYAQAVYDYLVARALLDEAVGVVPGVDAQSVGWNAGGGS